MIITVNTRQIQQKMDQYPQVVAYAALGFGGIVGWKLVKKVFTPRVYKFEADAKQLKLLQEFGGRIHYWTKKGEFILVPLKEES